MLESTHECDIFTFGIGNLDRNRWPSNGRVARDGVAPLLEQLLTVTLLPELRSAAQRQSRPRMSLLAECRPKFTGSGRHSLPGLMALGRQQ